MCSRIASYQYFICVISLLLGNSVFGNESI